MVPPSVTWGVVTMFDNPPIIAPGAEKLRKVAAEIDRTQYRLDMTSWNTCAWPIARDLFVEIAPFYQPPSVDWARGQFPGMTEPDYRETFGGVGLLGASNRTIARQFRRVADRIEARAA